MKRTRLLCAVFVLAAAILLIVSAVMPRENDSSRAFDRWATELSEKEGTYNPYRIIVEGLDGEAVSVLAEKMGAEIRTIIDGEISVLLLPESLSISDIAADEAYAAYAEHLRADYYVRPCAVASDISDPYDIRTDINLQQTWDVTTGEGITVAVIDTGIATDCPAFAGRISDKSFNASTGQVVSDYDMSVIEDTDGHGTTVASVLAADPTVDNRVFGVAPGVTLLVIKCELTEDGEYSASDLIAAIAYAVEQDADVINMSFFFWGEQNPFQKMTRLAMDSDCICVAAAGDFGTSAMGWPAADENVIGVGAVSRDAMAMGFSGGGENAALYELTETSNYGYNSELTAPGKAVAFTANGEKKEFEGTSISSAMVSGAIAMHLSQCKDQEFGDVLEMLRASSKDLGMPGLDWYYGCGLLDADALVVEEKGTITYDYLTDEIGNRTQPFVRGHKVQYLDEPERLYSVFDGWYTDIHCTDEFNWQDSTLRQDVTLYAAWANEDDTNPFTYIVRDDGTASISGYLGKRKFITVPGEIDGYTVTSIGAQAFLNNNRLREVVLPDTLLRIEEHAFDGCTRLTDISIPRSVQSIDEYAFSDCSTLYEVAIPADAALKEIGSYAFAQCGMLSRFDVPDHLEAISGDAFYADLGLRQITVSASCENYRIEDHALCRNTAAGKVLVYYPAGLTTAFDIPAEVTGLGDFAFNYSNARTITCPDSLAELGKKCFINARITEITLPDGIVSIPGGTFIDCRKLERVYLPDSITMIGDEGFFGCYALTQIQIDHPAVNTIGAQAFMYCSKLENMQFIGENVTVIDSAAFYGCGLSEIYLPASLRIIGSRAFQNCWKATALRFAADFAMTALPNRLFYGCGSITEVDLPAQLKVLGSECFSVTGIRVIRLPANVEEIGYGTFSECRNLEQIQLEDGNPVYYVQDNVLYERDQATGEITLHTYPANNTASFIVPENVSHIGALAFYANDNLTDVVFSGSLKTIEQSAFMNCGSLQSVSFEEGLKELGSQAFSCCTLLASVDLPDSVETIQNGTFAYCQSLREFTLPLSLTSVGIGAFQYCSNLAQITFPQGTAISRLGYGAFSQCGITSIVIPASVQSMGQSVFKDCEKLTTVQFAENSRLTAIAAWTFEGANNLESVHFGDGNALTHIQARAFENLGNLRSVNLEACTNLKTIDNYAFQFCKNLGNVTLPTSMEHIGRYAFFGCAAMDEICIPENVNYIGRYAFANTNSIKIFFSAPALPETLQENWDYGIGGYYLGTSASQTEGSWTYTVLPDGSACVVAYNGTETEIELQTIAGCPVSAIGAGAFADNTTLQSITLPDTLVTICDRAFQGTSTLEAIEIPAGVTFIGAKAFAGSGLASISFGTDSSLKIISNSVFAETANLKAITIPASVTEIKAHAFYHSGVETVTFPESSQLNLIGRYAFSGSALKTVALPDALAKVDYYAFAEAEQLESVLFGTGTVQLYGRAFFASGLRQVNVPANVEYLGECCFADCSDLTAITVAEDNPYYSSDQGILFNKTGTKLIACPAGKTGSYTIPADVSTLGFSAFEESRLTTVTIPADSELVTIGYRAFFNCHQLEAVRIPDTIVSIDFYAFAYCANLQTVTMGSGSSLTGIYEGAFLNCRSLSAIFIPNSVREIADMAFSGCESLAQVTIEADSTLVLIGDEAFAYSGVVAFDFPDSLRELGDFAFAHSKITSVVLPDSVREVGDCAFAYSDVTVLELPDEIREVGGGLLLGCTDVTRMKVPTVEEGGSSWPGISCYFRGGEGTAQQVSPIPETLTDITITQMTAVPVGAFCGMQNLKTVTYLKTIHSVGNYAFRECGSLESIPSLDHVTAVGEFAFYRCGSLREVGSSTQVRTIGMFAFCECGRLTDVALDSVESIGSMAFHGCDLTSVHIPGSCHTIGKSAFEFNRNLREVILDEGIERIEDEAFYCCPIQSFEIPSTLKYVGSQVVYGYMEIPLLVIPETVEHLGEAAFYAKQVELHCMDAELAAKALVCECAFVTGDADGAAWDPDWAESVGSCFYGCGQPQESTDGLLYRNSKDGALILGYTGSTAGLVLDFVDGQPVHAVCRNAFAGNATVTSVEMGENVSRVDSGAFCECPNLEEVTVRGTLGDSVFAGCPKLTRAVLCGVTELSYNTFGRCPALAQVSGIEDMEVIGRCVFQDDSALTEITLGDRLTEIGGYAFRSAGLTEIVIPDSVTSLGESAFLGCTSLQAVTIGEGITEIKNYTFRASAIHSISLGENVSAIGNGAFSECRNLETVSLPGVVAVGNSAFINCQSLKSIAVGPNLESIGTEAFRACGLNGDLYLPASLNTIGRLAFYENPSVYLLFESDTLPGNLEEDWDKGIQGYSLGASFSALEDPETGLTYHTIDGCALVSGWNGTSGDLTIDIVGDGIPVTAILSEALAGSAVEQLTLGPSVQEVRSGAFRNCGQLRSVQFAADSSLTEIGDEAFYACGLEELDLPASVTRIGVAAFRGNTALRRIALPDTLTAICDYAFMGCSQLSECNNPSQIRYLGAEIFSDCGELFEYRNGAAYVGSWLYRVNYPGPDEYTVEAGTTAICGRAFWCLPTKAVIIPEGVTLLGNRPFGGCSSLTSVQLPNTLRYINADALAGLPLETLEIPDSVEEIGEGAFCALGSLQSISLPFIGCSAEDSNDIWHVLGRYVENMGCQEKSMPKSITITGPVSHIYGFAMYGATVESVSFTDPCVGGCVVDDEAFRDLSKLQHVDLPDTVTSIGKYAFYECELEELDLPDALTSIGASAFAGCKLKELDLPDALTSIGASAFAGNCFTELRIPNGVETLETSTFANCSSLMHIELPVGLTSLGDLVFDGCTSLISLEIPDSVEHIGEAILNGCVNLVELKTPFIGETVENTCHIRRWYNRWGDTLNPAEKVTITGTPTELPGWLSYSTNLEEVCLPDTIETLKGAFAGCCNLRTLNIPSALKEIGADTFSGCVALPCIDIPASVESIDHRAFTDVKTLILRCGACYPSSGYNVETLIINYQGTLPYHPTKNLVLLDGSTHISSDSFRELSGISIFCYQPENAVTWPDGWNNGNPVSYEGTWKSVTFWKGGTVVKTALQGVGEVLLLPPRAQTEREADGDAEYTLVGWDITADGRADRILSTTLSGEIRADAVYSRAPKAAIEHTTVGMDVASQTDEAIVLDAVTNHSGIVKNEVIFDAGMLDNSRGAQVVADLGSISFDKEAVGVISSQVEEKVKVSLEEIPAGLLTATDENSKLLDLTLCGDTGSIAFSSNGLGTANITVNCPGYSADHRAYVYRVSEGGVWSAVDSAYDAEDGCITFSTDHFSLYVVSSIKPTCTEHNYMDVIVDPTCVEDGYTVHICKRCGESFADTYVPALGHHFVYGVCTRCGVIDADYIAKRIQISAGSVTASRGEVIVVPLTVDKNDGFAHLGLSILADPGLTLTDIRIGSLLNNQAGGQFSADTDSQTITWLSEFNVMECGEIALLVFRVNDEAPIGDTAVSVALIDKDPEQVTDTYGTALEPTFVDGSVSVCAPLAITTQPADYTGALNEMASFHVEATGIGLTYQWQYKSLKDGKWYNASATGARTDTMSIEVTAKRDGLRFRCKVTDSSGGMVYSSAAALRVQTTDPLVITTQPMDFTGPVGATATFHVEAAGIGLTYQWQYKSLKDGKWYNASATGAKMDTMSIEVTNARNGLQFRCKVTDSSGGMVYSSAAVLRVQTTDPLVITTQPVDFTGPVGATATFHVEAAGIGLTYQWQYKSLKDGKWYSANAAGAKTDTMSIEITAKRDGLQFRCIVTDASGDTVTSNAAALHVQ